MPATAGAPDWVFLLGSGFSRAISDRMPVMAELASEVRERLSRANAPLPTEVERLGDDVEQWLSYLADRQPWLDEAANLRNRAHFLNNSHVIGETIGERQSAGRGRLG